MNAAQLEYDRFGPWISEISPLDPVPPLFTPYPTRPESPLLNIKIPRDIDRRDARPGMPLYDYLVTLYETDMVILARDEAGVTAETIAYSDIRSLSYSEELLQGALILGLDGRAYNLRFSTVSKDIIRRLIDLVRARYLDGTPITAVHHDAPAPTGQLSFLFTSLLAKERRARQLLAAQADTPIGREETNLLRRLAATAGDKRLLESLHFSDGREPKILRRGRPYKYLWQKVYALDTLYLPLHHVHRVQWHTDQGNTAVIHLTLQTDAGPHTYSLTRDNPALQTYRAYLAALSRIML